MESQRSFLVLGLLFVSFLLWQNWQLDYGPKTVAVQEPVNETSVPDASQQTGSTNGDVPASRQSAETIESASVQRELIKVDTGTLELVIDTLGGDVISANLLKFPIDIDSDDPTVILSSESSLLYTAQSGLIGQAGPDSKGRPLYQSAQSEYTLSTDKLTVPLTYISDDGIQYKKSYIFTKDSHTIEVQYEVTNSTASTISFQQYGQLKQKIGRKDGSMFMPTYRGAAYSYSDDLYEKHDFSDFEDDKLNISTPAGWVAMIEHYFVSAWVPPQEESNNIFSTFIGGDKAVIGYTGKRVSIAPGETKTVSSHLYIGPKHQDVLANLAKGLDLTVDYGFLWILAQGLFWLLSKIQLFVVNWGLAIIIITVIVKGLMYPLTKAQYESMAKMRALAPKIQALKDRYGDDRQKMSQGMMDLYKKEKTNPMGGCFPLLLQMPIFLSLYWVLLESVELRHADFVFWIKDLSVMDPYFVLPVLTGASMYLLQKLNPVTVQDPMQQKIMQYMPVVMSIFFLWFPAGLVLYWLVSNVITIVQAKLIYAAMERKGLKVN